MLRKTLISTLASAGVAFGASCNNDVSIASQADLTAVSSCTSITGNVNISSTISTISLPSLQTINGDLTITGATLETFTASVLSVITGNFNINGVTRLSTLSIPTIRQVGNIRWQTLPALTTLGFTQNGQGGIVSATDVYISDTNLESLNGINLTSAGIFDINNNRYLKDITVQLKNVTEALSVEFNSKQVAVSFPSLIWANNFTVRDCGSVSTPNLVAVNGSLGFINNTATSYSAPKLTNVGQAVAFVSNQGLKNVSMPQLTTIGGTLQLANNSDLAVIDGFPKVQTVGGSIDFSGVFTNVSLPSINDVRGGLNVQTTQTFDCGTIDQLKNNVVKGNSFYCSGKVAKPTTENGSPSSSSSGNGTSSTPKKNASDRNGIHFGGMALGMALAALFSALLI